MKDVATDYSNQEKIQVKKVAQKDDSVDGDERGEKMLLQVMLKAPATADEINTAAFLFNVTARATINGNGSNTSKGARVENRIEMHRRLRWRQASCIASHKEETWTKTATLRDPALISVSESTKNRETSKEMGR